MVREKIAIRPESRRGELNSWLRLITAGGCLAMVFMTCIQSPVTTEFFRQLGATKLQFGIIGGLPMLMLGMQFYGAFLTNRLTQRKPLFLASLIGGRLVFLVIAYLPLALDGLSRFAVVNILIILLAAHYLVVNLSVPLWFSWMGDLIPSRILNRYWGRRHQLMTLCWTMTYIGIAFATYRFSAVAPDVLFRWLVTIGVLAGIVDILLFIKVGEPINTRVQGRSVVDVLLQPLRDRHYRSYISFNCVWMASAMLAAAFMQLYVLEVLLVPLWKVNLIWCTPGLGAALVARFWGRIADAHGTRPIIILSTAGKPIIVIVFLLVTPGTALLVLPIFFFFDSMFNAAMQIANNGYMLKMAPTENRSMFVAATLTLTGLAGGLGATAGGWMLDRLDGQTWLLAGHVWNNFHLLFVISFCLRIGCFIFAFTIREPTSSSPLTVLSEFRGTWPLRILMFPVGLYRRLTPGSPDGDGDDVDGPFPE